MQIPLSDYRFFETGEQSFADAYRGGCEKMCFVRKVPQGMPDECGAGHSISGTTESHGVYPMSCVCAELSDQGTGTWDEKKRTIRINSARREKWIEL